MTRERQPQKEECSVSFDYIIVGYGNIGHKRHVSLKEKCLATVSRNPARGANFPSSNEVPREIVDKCGGIIITVPDEAKIQEVSFWLAKGKPVLVEKPFLIGQKEFDLLSGIAEKNDTFWYTSYNHRFEPHVLRIKSLLDGAMIGDIYLTEMTYGFGNVAQLKGTWRDSGIGILSDVASHLIDLSNLLLGYKPKDFQALKIDRVELENTFDNCVLRTKDKKTTINASYLSWKNQFRIDIVGSKGSIHMDGLCKWGESQLLVRKRVFPPGPPSEKKYIETGPDLTWEKDILHFERMIKEKYKATNNDVEMTDALYNMATSL